MITKLKVKNWKSHISSELKFSAGTNALLGIMGSGKTSLIQAISFALFGETPELRYRQISLDDLIMRKPDRKGFAEVELYFTSDGKKFSVKRKIERGNGTTHSEIRKDGKLIEAPQTSKVTSEVVSILGIDFELFEKAVYARQNEIDFFLTLSAGERKKKMDSFLNIDKIESARSSLNPVIRDYSSRLSEKKNNLSKIEIESLFKEIETLEKKISEKEREKESLEKKGKELQEKIDLRKEKIEELKKKKEEWEKLNISIESNRSIIESEKKMLENLEDVDLSLAKELEMLEQRVEKLKENQKRLSDLSSKLNEQYGILKELSSQLSDIPEKSIDEAKKSLEEVESALTKSESKLKELEPLEKESLLFEKKATLKSEIERLEKELKEMKLLEKELKELKIKVSDLSELKQKLKDQRSRKASINALIEEKKDRLSSLGESGPCPTCETPLSDLERYELKQKIKTSIKSLKSEFEKLDLVSLERSIIEKERLSKTQFSHLERLAILQKEVLELESKKNELNEINQKISKEKTKQDFLKEKESLLRKEIEKLKEEKREKKRALEDAEKREKLSKRFFECKEKITDFEEKEKSLKKEIAELENSESLLEKAKIAKERKRRIDRIEKLKSELEIDLSKKNQIEFNAETLDNENRRYREESAELASTKTELNHIPEALSQNKNLLSKLKEEKDTYEELTSEIKKLEFLRSDLRLLKDALKLVQNDLRETFIYRINEAMTAIWTKLYPYGDFSGVRLSVTSKGDYKLELSERTGWRSVEGLASGGERSIACLALRIAFARVLAPQLRLIFLDEPTHNLDSNGIDELSTALRERIPSIIDQTILITHESALENSVTGYCYRIKREKDRDQPSKIELLSGE